MSWLGPVKRGAAETLVGAAGAVATPAEKELLGAEAAEVPTAFVAVTVKVYEVPEVRFVTWQEVVFASGGLHVPPPELAVTVYPVMADPPSEGLVQLTAALDGPLEPTTAETLVGAAGTEAEEPEVVTVLLGAEGTDVKRLIPSPFDAVTVKVYEVPDARPVTSQVVVVKFEVEQVRLPGDEVTVNFPDDRPPLNAPAVQLTVAVVPDAVALTVVGASGAPAFTAAADPLP